MESENKKCMHCISIMYLLFNLLIRRETKLNTLADRLDKDEKTIEEIVGKVDKIFDALTKQVNELVGEVGRLGQTIQAEQGNVASLGTAISMISFNIKGGLLSTIEFVSKLRK